MQYHKWISFLDWISVTIFCAIPIVHMLICFLLIDYFVLKKIENRGEIERERE